MGLMKRGVVAEHDDDDEWESIKLVTGPSDSNSRTKEFLLSTQYTYANQGRQRKGCGVVLTIHQSCDRGEGKDQDGQHGHIISPGLVSHLSVDHSCNKEGLQNVY